MVRKFKRKFGAPEQDWKRKQSQAAKIKAGSDTGIRTRILALRGPRPNP
jgi:hypothetical protein